MAQIKISAVPATRLSVRSLRIRQNAVLIAVLIAALCGPLALFRSSSSVSTSAQAYEVPEKTVAFATRIAEDFLAGTPTDLPVAAGVDPTFGSGAAGAGTDLDVSHLTVYSSFSSLVNGTLVDAVRFNVDVGSEPLWLWVSVSYDGSNRPVLAAQPSFLPKVVAQSGVTTAPKFAGATEEIPALVRDRVDRWAEAYVSGDSDTLKVLVNDELAPLGGSYAGLQGFSCEQGCSRVLWAAPSARLEGFAIVRVELVLQYSATNGDGMSASRTLTSHMDLLVRGWRSDAPRVQAWGPAGSGDVLYPYSNNTAVQA